MSEPPDAVIVGADGSVQVAGRGAARRLAERPGRYRLVVDVPGMVVLREAGDRTEQARARVLMAGEIVTRMTVMEVINVVANASWRGEMHVIGPDSHRVLSFDQGALKHAQSDDTDDRLGEVLYRMGVLDRGQLDDLLREITPERRFGQLLVDQGLVQDNELFEHLQTQAQQIFYNALLVGEGHYLFRLPHENDPPPSATLHIPIQHLLMEGVQRVDEMALFRERIPSDQMCPEVKPGAGAKDLDATAATLLAYCDGERSIEDIARETGLGEFETTKGIYHLMQQGQVVLRSGTKIDEEAVRRIVASFNDVMRDIFMAVATYGGIDTTRDKLKQWIQNSDYKQFLGEDVEEDGSIDFEQAVERLRGLAHEHPLEDLHRALHELAAYALFTASGSLSRQQELSLTRDVHRRLKTVRM